MLVTGILQQSEIDKYIIQSLKNIWLPHELLTMSCKTRKAGKSEATGSRDGTLFGATRKNAIATYSKNRPVQIAKKHHFLTPDTPEEWIPSSKETSSKQGTDKKGTVQ